MVLDKENNAIMNRFMPYIGKATVKWRLAVIALILVSLIGVYALIRQITDGQIITGMRDNAVWGIYTANFIFFLGISYAGALIGSVLHLTRINWGRPYLRMLELMSVAGLIVGAPYILFCLGRLDRIHYLFIYGRIQSPITWDVIAIITDLFFCMAFLILNHIRDFSLLRDSGYSKFPKWRVKFYKFFSFGYKGLPQQVRHLKLAKDILAAIIIPTSIIAYSLLSWLFAISLRSGWHSSIFGPYFVLTAIYSGISILIILMWIYRKKYHLEDIITKKHFNYFGFALLITALFYGYFSFSDYITDWYNSQKTTSFLLEKLISFNEFGWLFWFSTIAGILLPIIIIGIPWFRSIKTMVVASVLILLALWVKRYLIVIPTLLTPYIPIQDTRTEWVNYTATWVEWALSFAGIAIFILIFMLGNKYAPVIPAAETNEEEEKMPQIFKKTKG
jgi:Ni/Fe-hydrogenase subunit HybB-like protein